VSDGGREVLEQLSASRETEDEVGKRKKFGKRKRRDKKKGNEKKE
jgi:hypothetical protein